MPLAAAVFTSDPNLLRCELARLREALALQAHPSEPMGAGWYAEGAVLLQRYSGQARPDRLEHLGGVLESEALLVHSAPLAVGLSLEENTQPFRFRQWLFAHAGQVTGHERLRTRLLDALPEHLARVVRGSTASELVFALFLSELRAAGKLDDENLDASEAAGLLGAAARKMEQYAQDVGVRPPSLALFATNNRVLAVARVGEQPVLYKLLEGTPVCDVCRLDPLAKGTPAVRAHLQRRSVAVATSVAEKNGWIPVESGQAIGVGPDLAPKQIAI